MKHLYSVMILTCSVFFMYSVGPARATLMATSNPSVVYDDIADLYWISDLTLLTNLTYQEQIATIDEWNASGTFASDQWGDLRMATIVDVGATFYHNYEYSFGQYQDLFTGNYFTGDGEGFHGRTSSQVNSVVAPDRHRDVSFQWWDYNNWLYYEDCGDILDSSKSTTLGAWVVATPVPEPTSGVLFTAGIIGLWFISQKKSLTGNDHD